MDNFFSYYSTIFNISITVIGISLTAMFVFFQIIQSKFQRSTKRLLNPLLFFVIITSGLVVAFSSIALLKISTNYFDYLPFDLHSREIIQNSWFMFALLGVFFLSIILTICYLISVIRLVNPAGLLKIVKKDLTVKVIKNFLYFKSGLSEPMPNIRIVFIPEVDGQAPSSEEQEKEEQYKKDLIRYKKLKKSIKKAANPIEPFTEIVLESANRNDIFTVREAYNLLIQVSKEFFITVDDSWDNKKWNEENGLYKQYLQFLFNEIEACLDTFMKNDFNVGLMATLSFLEDLLSLAIELNKKGLFEEILKFCGTIADRFLNKFPAELKKVIHLHENTAKLASKSAGGGDLVESVCQSLLFLGEKIIKQQEFDNESKYIGAVSTSFFSELRGVVLEIGALYSEALVKQYPLIFLDVVIGYLTDFIAIEQQGKINREQITRFLESILYDISIIAVRAIENEAFVNAELVLMRLGEIYDLCVGHVEEDKSQEILLEIMTIGARYAENKVKAGSAHLLGKNIDEWVINKLHERLNYPLLKAKIDSHVLNIFIKATPNRDFEAGKDFLRKLGQPWNTTFGLNL